MRLQRATKAGDVEVWIAQVVASEFQTVEPAAAKVLLRRSLRTSHHHTRQLVTADRKVPSTLQISAGAAATEEGGARQVVASQLQADI